MRVRSNPMLAIWVVACVAIACDGGSGATVDATAPPAAGASSPTTSEAPLMSTTPSQTTQPGSFILNSSAFTDGGPIPAPFTCDGRDVSPPLAWSGAPDGTAAFLLTMRDPDARGFLHWIAWNVPASTEDLPEGASGALPGDAGEGRSDFGSRPGYRGPCPPSGTHRYVMTLYALPMALADADTTPTDRLEQAAAQIALATATLTGTYRRQ